MTYGVEQSAYLSSQGKKPIENLQKYMENEEYLRSIESGEEQNHSVIDGNKNNCKKKIGRASVLKKLPQKQVEIAKRRGKPTQQMEVRRIWSVDGSKKRGKYLACAAECFFLISGGA